MSKEFTYNLSYFREGEISSLEIYVDTDGEEAYGFQLIANIEADPGIILQDQESDIEGIQLDLPTLPMLNFVTNKAVKTDTGYQVVLAAITRNPKEYYVSDGKELVGQLLFTQDSKGSITVSVDQEATKIKTKGRAAEDGTEAAEDETVSDSVQTIPTEDAGETLQYLQGSTYQAPEIVEENEVQKRELQEESIAADNSPALETTVAFLYGKADFFLGMAATFMIIGIVETIKNLRHKPPQTDSQLP